MIGIYNGYRPAGATEVKPGLRDNIEHYNILKFLPQFEQSHPEVLRRHWNEIGQFHRHVHEHIAYKLLRLIAIALEIPEFYLVDGHRYESNCDSHIRYMMTRARSPVENQKFKDIYLRGHTDRGTLSFVFHQPVAGLQVRRNKASDWEYVKIRPGTAVVNSADLIEIVTNGYLKSGLHRVVAPPEDQSSGDRLGVLYFVRPSDRLWLRVIDSPLLRRLGHYRESETHGFSALMWTRERVRKAFASDPKATTQMGGFTAVSFHE
jgi:isopenicillin N synthase-like dioxygenase